MRTRSRGRPAVVLVNLLGTGNGPSIIKINNLLQYNLHNNSVHYFEHLLSFEKNVRDIINFLDHITEDINCEFVTVKYRHLHLCQPRRLVSEEKAESRSSSSDDDGKPCPSR